MKTNTPAKPKTRTKTKSTKTKDIKIKSIDALKEHLVDQCILYMNSKKPKTSRDVQNVVNNIDSVVNAIQAEVKNWADNARTTATVVEHHYDHLLTVIPALSQYKADIDPLRGKQYLELVSTVKESIHIFIYRHHDEKYFEIVKVEPDRPFSIMLVHDDGRKNKEDHEILQLLKNTKKAD